MGHTLEFPFNDARKPKQPRYRSPLKDCWRCKNIGYKKASGLRYRFCSCVKGKMLAALPRDEARRIMFSKGKEC